MPAPPSGCLRKNASIVLLVGRFMPHFRYSGPFLSLSIRVTRKRFIKAHVAHQHGPVWLDSSGGISTMPASETTGLGLLSCRPASPFAEGPGDCPRNSRIAAVVLSGSPPTKSTLMDLEPSGLVLMS